MGLLTKVLTFPVSLPAAGLKGVILKIHETAETQFYNADAVRAQLVALGDALDRGEMTEDAFEELEEQLLDRLDEIAAYELAKAGGRP
ncbi:MAG: gas vesicle protein GvpG [Pseudomonadota bacterium]